MRELVQQLNFFGELGVTHLNLKNLNRVPALPEIREEMGECTRCKLHRGRQNIVYGVGNPEADLMFVGEAPGADEAAQGVPFVGRAGQLLTRIIESIGLQRECLFVARKNLSLECQLFVAVELLQVGPHPTGSVELKDALMTLHHMLILSRPQLEFACERAQHVVVKTNRVASK